MRGKVERIWRSKLDNGIYWILSIDGQRYTYGRHELPGGMREGSQVDYLYRETEGYRSLSRLSVIGQRTQGSRQRESPSRDYQSERDRRLFRASCLRSATQMIYEIDMKWEDKVRETLNLAKQFERYVIGE